MSGLHELLFTGVAYRLGWTLLHSLWQGAAVAMLFAIALLIVPARRPAARYAIGCGCLVVLLLTTGLTLVAVSPPVPHAERAVAEAVGEWLTGAQDVDAGGGLGRESLLFVDAPEAESASLRNPHDSALQASAGEVMTSDRTWSGRLARRLAPSLPWMAAAWLGGVLVLSLWRLGGCVATYRLRSRATLPVDSQVAAMVLRCCRQLGVSRPVRILRSMVIRTPAVIGHLRPVVLLPVAAVSGLSPVEIEAIIAHELAHIRRHDYLVGLIQSAIEILFFHHPAVWWISRCIRIEREYCCDDLVVAVGQGKLVYAEALTKLAPLAPSPAAALGATGGSLLDRIRRLASADDDDAQVGRTRSAAGLVLSAFLVFAAIGAARHLIAKPAESQPDAAATQPAVNPQASRPAAASQPVSDLLSILNSIFAGPTHTVQIGPTGEWIRVRSGENELRIGVSGDELAGEWTAGDQGKEIRCRSLILSNSASGKSWQLEVKSGKLTLVETNGGARHFVLYDNNVRIEELDEELFSKRIVRVFKPKHLDAARLAELVRDHYPPPSNPDRNGIVSARTDEAGRVVLSYAPPLDDRIVALLQRLDVPQARESEPPGPQETGRSASSQPDESELVLQELAEEQVSERIVRVFQPKHVAPEVLAEAIAKAFPPSANDRPDTVITAQADKRTRVLVMSYSPAREQEVFALLDRLDVSGERADASADEVQPGTLQVAVEMRYATVSAEVDRELQRKLPAKEVSAGVWITEPLDAQQADYLLTELDRQADGVVDAPRVVTFDGRSAWMEMATHSSGLQIDGRSVPYDVPLGVRLDVQPEVDADRKHVRMDVQFKKTGVVSRQGRQVEQTVDAHGTFTLPDRAFILLRTQIKQHRIRARAVGGSPATADDARQIVREPMPLDAPAAYSYLLVRPTIIFPPTDDDEGPAIAVPNAATRPAGTGTDTATRPAGAAPVIQEPQASTRVYDVSDLVRGEPAQDASSENIKLLTDLIERSVEPGSWATQRASRSIEVWNDRLVVTCTEARHRQLVELLGVLRHLNGESPAGDPTSAAVSTRPADAASPAKREIQGKIVDHDGEPVAGAEVSVGWEGPFANTQDLTNPAPPQITTQADGSFVLTDPSGYADRIRVSRPVPVTRVLKPEDSGREILIRLPEPATLAMRFDIPHAEDEAEFVLQLMDWSYALRDVSPWMTFRVRNHAEAIAIQVPAGRYALSRSQPLPADLSIFLPCNRRVVTLEPGGATTVALVRTEGHRLAGELALPAGSRSSEAVVYILAPAAEGLSKAEALKRGIPVLDVVTCGPDGRWQSELIPPGDYFISAEAYALRPKRPRWAETHEPVGPTHTGDAKVSVPRSGEPPTVHIQMAPGQDITSASATRRAGL